ncbi:phospho-acceptor domain-containing protein [Algoriphagus ratkowskyi]|uniref:histidine kinase n=1 Tax=Algoriphagus ratkowskyi TaxID=57028 RepID=A0A2W7RHD7_9BACT|nr:ATP-binding protein [Algoriphagus ratkowskyi]PZX58496.1 phospho-acceptor domain-containing protein [Algoriphagus ratkowskyi]TXD77644.1 histidine kinase [Algoriphagus ratkowskyi]
MDFILLIIAFRFLQRHPQTKEAYPEWQGIFLKGLIAACCFLAIQIIFERTDGIVRWVAHFMNLAVLYATYNKKAFFPLKPYVYAFFPVVLVHIVQDLSRLIAPTFYNSWNELFNTAGIFAWIWLGAQFFINYRQRKALEAERIKAVQKEIEFKKSQQLKDALEIQVAERTTEIMAQKEELLQTITELKSTQSLLIQSEKMASLGELTAGIAHEIQNPLNFVTNFSELNKELLEELKVELDKGDLDEIKLIVGDIERNEEKIHHHGKRADAIVKGMLQHSRSSSGVKEATNINELADEYLRLSYHGLRAKDKSFNASMETNFDESAGIVNVVSQEIGRVILNLVNNAFYAVGEKKRQLGESSDSALLKDYKPTVWLSTKRTNKGIEIRVKDNGTGMPDSVKDKIFQPFFTTKPTGLGTGLGLSLSYDIVKSHGGELLVESRAEEGTEFCIRLPIDNQYYG